MKLFIDSIFLLAASMNSRIAADETPCDFRTAAGQGLRGEAKRATTNDQRGEKLSFHARTLVGDSG